MSDIFQIFVFRNDKKEEQSLTQSQEEGWEVQDGSTRLRRVVNSGLPIITGEEGGEREDWDVTQECERNVVCIFFLGQSFAAEDNF